jgi:hypothetical protein
MARYFAPSCPKCNGYLGIVLPNRRKNVPYQWPLCEMRLPPCVAIGPRKTSYQLLFPQGSVSDRPRIAPGRLAINPVFPHPYSFLLGLRFGYE